MYIYRKVFSVKNRMWDFKIKYNICIYYNVKYKFNIDGVCKNISKYCI